MALQLLKTYPQAVEHEGRRYKAKLFVEEQFDGAWHAWVAFFGRRGEAPLATDRATVQPNETALRWWAEGLTSEHLRDALRRALFLEQHPDDRTDERRSFAR